MTSHDPRLPIGRSPRAAARSYNRAAGIYDLLLWPLELCVHRRLRRRLFAHVAEGSTMLEIGVGTGLNFPFYPPGIRATANDISQPMLNRARRRAERFGVDVSLFHADAHSLPFADDSFDHVIATLVFCDIPDPVTGLRELARVCRDDGLVLLLEHVRPTGRLTGWLADLVGPALFRGVGIHINRETLTNASDAGLELLTVERALGVYRLIQARPIRTSSKGHP